MVASNRQIADAWLKYNSLSEDQRGENNPIFWAHQELRFLIRRYPENAWQIIRLMTNIASSELLLANIAAGPLEELIRRHGDRFINRIEHAAASDPIFRKMLGAIWRNGIPADVWKRISAVAGPSF